MKNREKTPWLDRPGSGTKIFWGLCIICALLAGVDLVIHRHAHFSWEGWPFFYCGVGFVAFWCIVIIGKHLRTVLWRPEDYYD